jgi:hypothetical protein
MESNYERKYVTETSQVFKILIKQGSAFIVWAHKNLHATYFGVNGSSLAIALHWDNHAATGNEHGGSGANNSAHTSHETCSTL